MVLVLWGYHCTFYPLLLSVGGGVGRPGNLPLILVGVAQGHAPSLALWEWSGAQGAGRGGGRDRAVSSRVQW